MKKRKLIKGIFFVIFLLYAIINSNFIEDFSAEVEKVNKQIDTIKQFNSENILEVQFIDVGQADSILIKKDDKYMLIDAGNNEDGPLLVKYFKEQGINTFEHVVATHAHEDHIGGMDDIVNNFDVNNFYMPDVLTTTKTFEDMLNALDTKNKMYTVLRENQTFKLSDVEFNTVYIGNNEEDLNDTSIVLKLSYEDISFLFTGDATKNVEKLILDEDIKSDILKVGHHGSSYSSSKEFLDKVNPSYGVIEVGKDNSYGHPHASVLKEYEDRNINVYRTDEKGTIIFKTDGEKIKIETINTETNG